MSKRKQARSPAAKKLRGLYTNEIRGLKEHIASLDKYKGFLSSQLGEIEGELALGITLPARLADQLRSEGMAASVFVVKDDAVRMDKLPGAAGSVLAMNESLDAELATTASGVLQPELLLEVSKRLEAADIYLNEKPTASEPTEKI